MKRSLKAGAVFAVVSLALILPSLGAERFSFSYAVGDRYRLVTNVDEWVYVNRRLASHVEIVNRIAFSVPEVKEGKGRLTGSFQTSEREAGSASAYVLTTDYDSDFWRDARGVFQIDDKYYMPVVRNVPVFPDRDLKPGDTWTALGEEKHDFRRSYGIPEPYRIPFTAGYEYLGNMTYEGVERPAFKAAYTLFYQPPRPSAYTKAYPAQIMGHSEQVVYWDAKAGQPAAYTETFKIIIEQSDGTTVEFTGSAEGKVIEAQLMDRDAVERKVKDEIARLGIGDANVRQDEKGVVISLENIQFLGDSSVLQPSEKEKLQKISQILSSFPDRDIMVTGHTALAATEERRQVFSEERARVVGDYLISTGVVTAERMTTRGMGAKQPLADNSTEAGMRRNRRVEIMILEN